MSWQPGGGARRCRPAHGAGVAGANTARGSAPLAEGWQDDCPRPRFAAMGSRRHPNAIGSMASSQPHLHHLDGEVVLVAALVGAFAAFVVDAHDVVDAAAVTGALPALGTST